MSILVKHGHIFTAAASYVDDILVDGGKVRIIWKDLAADSDKTKPSYMKLNSGLPKTPILEEAAGYLLDVNREQVSGEVDRSNLNVIATGLTGTSS